MSIKRDTAEERKALPLATGVLDYFPDALLAVSECSLAGNVQHELGPLHCDALMRHLLDRGTRDSDGIRHSAKVAWRALALLQRELDAEVKPRLVVHVDFYGFVDEPGAPENGLPFRAEDYPGFVVIRPDGSESRYLTVPFVDKATWFEDAMDLRPFHYHTGGVAPDARCYVDHAPDPEEPETHSSGPQKDCERCLWLGENAPR